MPPDVLARLQQSAAVLRGDEALTPFAVPPDTWGFCRVVEPAALQAGTAPRGAWASQLELSQAFEAPDAVERMARTYGVTPHATLASPPQCAATSARVAALAATLKGETQSAWAAEAVRRGVAHARGGDLEAALRCYAQALELVPTSIDAHVARGAALANCGRLAEGRQACEAALRLDPSDRNAQQYLDAIVAKLAAQPAQAMPNTAEAVAMQAAAAPALPTAAIAPRGIEPPGPVAPPAAAAPPPARAGEPAVAALNDALRAAADKLRRKRKHSRKHDSAKKKSKKHKKEKKRRARSASRSGSSSSSDPSSR